MKIDRFNEFEIVNEAFGSSLNDYGKSVKYRLMDIICDVKGISEKDFIRLDELKKRIDMAFHYNPEIDEAIKKYERENKRTQFCAEHIYEWFIKDTEIEKNI